MTLPPSDIAAAAVNAADGESIATGVRRIPEYDALFAIEQTGYLGADGVFSLELSPERTFWLFGDTLVGELSGGRRRFDFMPRNSVAIQDGPRGAPGSVEKYWPVRDERHESYILLQPEGDTDRWFWPGTGQLLGGELFLFGYGIEPADLECEALSFNITGMWCVRVADPSGHPRDWSFRCERVDIPADRTFFCSGSLVEDDYLYLMGLQWVEERGDDPAAVERIAILARVPLEAMARAEYKLEYLTKNAAGEDVWSASPENLTALFAPGVTEASVIRDEPRSRLLATTYNASEGEFFLASAPRMAGPWSEPKLVFRPPEHGNAGDRISYTGRLHTHLARHPDEAVMTYVVNARTLEGALSNPSIYYPRFVSLDLTLI